ncbi:hypothetical protein E1B28_013667 [Marasmius oreades]|uniref:Anti-silencing function protein 1 n=1 Tax=Marasmius oreades TaxID=181124 RepID=A0A9P7UP87_9AGAR|nr:uncharacterized protein E1B28_013667 [Marasmius oreades]KAG7087721.1 hypothetical protein E1B28_013667 [Marasmius oreades]
MSIVTIRNVEFINNPARFIDPYRFRVTFEYVEWKLIYVSSPGNEDLDQELDDWLVGPVPVGVNVFEFEVDPPDPQKVPAEDILGVAALILTGSYNDQEFVRVGYYQNTEYDNEEMKAEPPSKVVVENLVRDINAKPRVTRFQIKWDVIPPLQSNGAAAAAAAAAGAINSAAVPSANDFPDGENDSMAVDSKGPPS